MLVVVELVQMPQLVHLESHQLLAQPPMALLMLLTVLLSLVHWEQQMLPMALLMLLTVLLSLVHWEQQMLPMALLMLLTVLLSLVLSMVLENVHCKHLVLPRSVFHSDFFRMEHLGQPPVLCPLLDFVLFLMLLHW
jgi:ABC-type proline/glycine betaine transport system permease subunit